MTQDAALPAEDVPDDNEDQFKVKTLPTIQAKQIPEEITPPEEVVEGISKNNPEPSALTTRYPLLDPLVRLRRRRGDGAMPEIM